MQKWEYLSMSYEYFEHLREFFLYINEELTVIPGGKFKPVEIMNRLGEEGWELVLGSDNFTQLTSITYRSLIFKRPKS